MPRTAARAAEAPIDAASGADPDGERLFAQGKLHYELGEYAEAIECFRRAYEKTRDPGFLFNVAQAHRLLGRCRQALQVYSHFLRLAPEHPNAVTAASNISILEAQCPAPKKPDTTAIAAPDGTTNDRTTNDLAISDDVKLGASIPAPANANGQPESSVSLTTAPSSWQSQRDGNSRRWRRVAVASTLTLGLGAAVGSVLLRQQAASYERQADRLALQLDGMGLVSVDGEPAPSAADLQHRRQRVVTLEERAEWSALALGATAGALLSAALVLWAPWESWSVHAGPRHVEVAFKF